MESAFKSQKVSAKPVLAQNSFRYFSYISANWFDETNESCARLCLLSQRCKAWAQYGKAVIRLSLAFHDDHITIYAFESTIQHEFKLYCEEWNVLFALVMYLGPADITTIEVSDYCSESMNRWFKPKQLYRLGLFFKERSMQFPFKLKLCVGGSDNAPHFCAFMDGCGKDLIQELYCTPPFLPFVQDLQLDVLHVEQNESIIDPRSYLSPALKVNVVKIYHGATLQDFFYSQLLIQPLCTRFICKLSQISEPFDGLYKNIFEEMARAFPNLEQLGISCWYVASTETTQCVRHFVQICQYAHVKTSIAVRIPVTRDLVNTLAEQLKQHFQGVQLKIEESHFDFTAKNVRIRVYDK